MMGESLNRRELLSLSSSLPLCFGLCGLRNQHVSAAQNFSVTHGISESPAKRCLMIFLWGGPSHIDLFDMKPLAPAEIRGEFQPIQTAVPGFHICEHMPHLARQTDKIALIRSLTHTDNNHSTSAHWMLTGHKHKVAAENFNAGGDDFPHMGSVLSHLQPGTPELPAFVALPEVIGTTSGAITPGQGGGILGQKFDPFRINQHPDKPNFKVPNLALPEGIDEQRLLQRMELLQQVDKSLTVLTSSERDTINTNQSRAVQMLTSPKAQTAFDLERESPQMRDRYGRQTFGQGLLLARRLLEAGVKLVTVYWHRDKPGIDTSWDTHGDNFGQLKNRLIPQVDQPIATLLDDLEQRGMLDDTLVVWNSEFGRTPRVNNNRGGRDHWGACNSVWLAGAGVRGGTIYGSSDAHAAKPLTNPVRPEDFAATIYSQLGVNPDTTIQDQLQRPFPVSEGRVIHEILASR